jgi:nucleoside-diphosphate-sugar epimerase
MKKILITGATGFLGSHIAAELVEQGYEVAALKRKTSDLRRCKEFKDKITWIDCDDLKDAERQIIGTNPGVLIHSAWSGIKAADRDNKTEQEKNLSFLGSLLGIVKKTGISKIIALGSQAEYGSFEGSVTEDHPCRPSSAYGAVKVDASNLLKNFAEQNKIDWYWIRLFSIFGPGEDTTWLIPAAILSLLDKKPMELTPCEQRYDYLFTKDFAAGIARIVNESEGIPGIYNLSGSTSIKIRDILTHLENRIAPNQNLLKIGTLPYRPGQVMHMEGNSDRFFRMFDFRPEYSVFEGLEETVKYYVNQRMNA